MTCSQKQLEKNYLHLLKLANQNLPRGTVNIIPMIKGNAYGHGSVWTAHVLSKLPSIEAFGVATVSEAIILRDAKVSQRMIVFSDAVTWNDDYASIYKKYNLEPSFFNSHSLNAFLKSKTKLNYHLEVNTGMNRMGISLEEYSSIKFLKNFPKTVFSHFADAENPSSQITQKQIRLMKELVGISHVQTPTSQHHFQNSAGLIHHKALFGDLVWPLVRPGLSLYGIAPEGYKKNLLRPVASVSAQVIAIRSLQHSETIGYGASYRVNDKEQRTAVIGAGYADGIHRSGFQAAAVSWKGESLKILGRVSMDLIVIEAPSSLKVGDRVEFFGKTSEDCWKIAANYKTIPYEFLTSLSQRVSRKYVP